MGWPSCWAGSRCLSGLRDTSPWTGCRSLLHRSSLGSCCSWALGVWLTSGEPCEECGGARTPRPADASGTGFSRERRGSIVVLHDDDQPVVRRVLLIAGNQLGVVVIEVEVERILRIGIHDHQIGVVHGELAEAQ